MKNPLAFLTCLASRVSPVSAVLAAGRNLFILLLAAAGVLTNLAQANSCAPTPAGLVGWWSAEGDATDRSGAHLGSFPFGSAFAVGEVGQAFDFDGSFRRVSIPESSAFHLTNAMTLEAWIYPRSFGGFITFRGDNRGGLDTWVLDAYETGFVKFQIDDEANNYQSVRAPLALNQWQHVAATWERASGDMKIYLNGVLIQQTNTTIVPIGVLDAAQDPAVGIGNHGGTFHQFPFNGLIDELAIFNRALTAGEILAIYNAGSAGKCPVATAPAPFLLNVDFGAGLAGTTKTGFAAIGQTPDDFWNFYTREDGAGGWRTFGVLPDLKAADGTVTTVGLTVANAPGAWGNGSSDPMYVDYIYPFDGGNVTVTVSNLPAGQYDVLPYAYDGNFEVSSGGISQGVQATYDATRANPPLWTPGLQYARFTNVTVAAGQPLVLTVRPGRDGWAVISGLQIVSSATTNVVPTTNCPTPPGLVSWWRAEMNSDDAKGSNHGMLRNGAAFGGGATGQAFTFSGSNSCVEIPHSTSLITSNYSIETWVKPAAQISDAISQDVIFGQSYGHCQLVARPGTTGVRIVWQFGASHFHFPEVASATEIPLGEFSHLAGTWDGTTLRLYINGSMNAESTPAAAPVDSGCAFFIGGFYNTNADSCGYVGQFFNGAIDEVSFYNRALTSNEIAGVFNAGSAGKCLPTNPPPQVVAIPVILSFSPTVATNGSTVIISGANFSPVASNNIVYFGAVQAGVTAASVNSLTVTVPTGATHAPITVTVNGLTAAAPSAFLPSFVGNGSNLTVGSFAPGQNLTVADGPFKTIIADIDGDGKPDLVEDNAYAHNISLFRNVGTGGTLDGSSFAPRVDFPALGGTDSPRCMAVADVDGDGKLDVLVGDQATSSVVVYRNIATPGTLTTGSLAAPVSFAAGSYPHGLRVADLNGDGRPEILVANQSGDSISILRNLGPAGGLTTNSFAPQYVLVTGPNPTDVAIADFNGDGKPDLVTTAFGGSQLSVFRNVAAPGAAVSNWFTLDTTLPALAGSLEFAVADMDGDAKSDLVVASVHGYAVSVYRNQAGAGAFSSNSFAARVDFATPGWVHNVSVGDFNGDGKPDLAVTGELNSYMAVFQNQSTPGSFTAGSLAARVDYATGWNAWGVAVGDLDGDHRPDIVFANSYDDTLTFYRNIVPLGEPTNPPPVTCVAAPVGLVGWWPAENQPTDVLGGNGGALLNGTGFGPGKVGQAFYFDGVNDSLTNVVGGIKHVTNSFTMEFWALPNAGRQSTAETYEGISGISGQRYAIYPDYGELGPVGAGVSVGTNGISVFEHGYVYLSSLLVYDAPVVGWTHIAVVYANAQPSLYVNGQQVRTGLVSTRIPYPSTRFGEAGADSLNYGYYSGGLDEVSIYNRALSPAEIQSIYNAGSAGKCPTTNPPPSVAIAAIASFDPAVATAGSSVTIVGTNFNSVASNNIVYFGAVRAVVTTANPTGLTAIVPVGATHAPITVTVDGLTTAARTDFTPTFAGGAALSTDSFSPRVNLGTGDGPTGTAIADFDGDGKPDLAVTDDYGHTLSVYRNISVAGTLDTGSFAPRVVLPASAADYSPYMIVTGDVDGDGKLDLITTDVGGNTVSVYRNQAVAGSLSPGSFAPFVSFATGAGPRSVALVDLDADGRPEIVTANYDSSTVSVLRNTGAAGQISSNSFAPRFDLPAGAGAHGLAVTDLDGDGRPDLATANAVGASMSLFRNVGSGPVASNSFAPAVTIPGPGNAHFVRAADLDADGRAELLLTSYLGQTLTVYRNQADSGVLDTNSFAAGIPLALAGRGHTISLGDLNGDSKVDVAVDTEIADSIALFQNQSAPGGFTNDSLAARVDLAAGWNAWGSSVGDLDGDGRPDIIFANTYDDTISIYRNVTSITNPPVGQAVLLVDGNTPGFYNDSLGTILDGSAPQFPLPLGLGGDPEFYPADEPNLAAAAAVLGNWLTAPADLNSNWQSVAVIPATWDLNTETAIIYALDGGAHGVVNLRGDFDADNGIYVWVNGQYKFGARAPGLPSPVGQFEYANVSLGSLTPGSNYLQILREDSGVSVGYQIRVTGTALFTNGQPPSITQSPTNQSVAAGGSAVFNVTAVGTPELYYQWRFNAGDLAGQTNSSLQLLNVQLSQAGEYSVLVSNSYGSVTSSVATLTVQTFPPTLTGQLQDQTVYAGKTVNLSVSATGTAPLRYHWSHNGTGLSNAVTATLTLVNVQSNHAGIYQVVVSNDYGSATSRLAQLTIVPPPPCAPAPDGVIAWWPGQSNLWDVVGGFDGQLSAGAPPITLQYTIGKVGAAFNFTSQQAIMATTGGGLNVNTNSGLTIEGWIRPTTSGPLPIAEWNDGKTVGAGLLVSIGGAGAIEATLTDSNVPVRTVTFRSPNFTITNSLWQHVALTYDKSAGIATILVNGNAVVQTNIGTLTPNTSGNVYLGYRPAGLYANARFRGALDEITLYNRSLSPAELQSIIAADETGKCPPPPPPCVRPPADIAAWWRGESNTVDMVAGNDAIRMPTNFPVTQIYQVGQLGTAFAFRNQNFLSVPRSEGLDVGTGIGLTVEAWIYPAVLGPMPIVEWTDTNTYGANLWLSFSRGPTVLEANLIDNAGGFHLIRSAVNTIRSATWQHVAVTYDKTTGIAALYSDGNLVTTTNLGFFTPRTHTELQIGFHPRSTGFTGDGAPPTIDYRFNGAIDELAIYRRALSAAEIRSVARVRPGKCLELPPTISRHPQEQIALEGGTARFEVGVGGTAPFQYQWRFAGNAIAAGTNSFLALAGVAPADTGFYSVLVSNAFGSVTSRVAVLTVLPANQCLPTPFGAVAFWRGQSNTVDELGSHPAQWGTNTLAAYTTLQTGGGKVATAFRFTGSNHLLVPTNSNLDVGAGGGFTIEGWIKPDSLSGSQPVWDWNDGLGNIGVGLLLGRTGPGMLEVTLTDTNVTSTQLRVVTLATPNFTLGSITNQLPAWSHVALTFDKATGKLNLFVNGKLVGERTIGLVPGGVGSGALYKLFSPVTTGNLHFGWRRSGVFQGSRFRGAMDEMSVYYRALTPLELQAIYIVGANGKCTPAPACQPLASGVVSWWRGESNVLDSVDGNHGSNNPAPLYTNGIVGSGFRTTPGRYIQIPAKPELNVGAGSGFTFETWFKLDNTSSYTVAAWNSGTSTQGVSFGSSPTRGPNYFEANLVDSLGNSHVLSFYTNALVVTGGLIPVGKWNHLAVTYEKLSGKAILFLNGSPVVATNLGSFTPRTTGNLYLGYRPPGNYPGSGIGLTGALDETTLYNRALSSGEITANYRNVANRCMMPPLIVQHPESVRVNPGSDVTFQVIAEGNPLLRYQWGLGFYPPAPRMSLVGQTNAALVLTNVQFKDSGRYWVQVTNAFGSAVSSNINLIVNSPPNAFNQSLTTAEDSSRSFLLLASDANQDPLIFTMLTQPTNGTLSATSSNWVYTPAPNYHGPDSFTFKVSDGLLESAHATVSITVTPVNDPPTAASQFVATDEDTPLPITLAAADVDGDALTFNITPPAHGTLSGTAPNLIYTPHANFFGDDLFTFTVRDGSNAVSELAAVSITVRPVNDAPVARISVSPLDELPGVTNLVVLAPACCDATVRLDASESTDVENDALTYAWVAGTNVLSHAMIVTNRFKPGTHEFTLMVSDGTNVTTATVTVEIITPLEAVDFLKTLVEETITERRDRTALLAWLRGAGEAFERCHVELGVNFLERFKRRVQDRIAPRDAELAAALRETALAIIEAAPDCDPCERLGRPRHKRQHDDRGRDDRDNDRGRERRSESSPSGSEPSEVPSPRSR